MCNPKVISYQPLRIYRKIFFFQFFDKQGFSFLKFYIFFIQFPLYPIFLQNFFFLLIADLANFQIYKNFNVRYYGKLHIRIVQRFGKSEIFFISGIFGEPFHIFRIIFIHNIPACQQILGNFFANTGLIVRIQHIFFVIGIGYFKIFFVSHCNYAILKIGNRTR